MFFRHDLPTAPAPGDDCPAGLLEGQVPSLWSFCQLERILSEAEKARLKAIIEEQTPFHRYLGIKVGHLGNGTSSLLIPFREELIGDSERQTFHGGVVSMLVATCGAMAVWARCSINDRIATVELRIDYLKPVPAGDLIARSRARVTGKSIGSAHTEIVSAAGLETVLAEGSSVYHIRRHWPER